MLTLLTLTARDLAEMVKRLPRLDWVGEETLRVKGPNAVENRHLQSY